MDKQDKKLDEKPAPQKAGPHDRFFKRLFSHPQTAPEFLKLILPKEDLLRLDLNRVRLEKDTFPDGKTADLLISAQVKGAPENSPRFHVLAEHKAEKIGRPAVRQLGGYQDDFMDGYWKERRRIPDILSVFAYQGKEPFAPPGGLKPAGGGAGPLAAPIAGFRESLGEDFFAKNPLTVRRFMIDFKMPVLDFIRGERVLEALKEGTFLCYPGLVLLHSIHERPADAEFIGYVFGEFNDFFRENEDLLLGAYKYLLDGYRADPAVLRAAEEKAVRDGILPGGSVMDVREEIREEALQEGLQKGRRAVILNMLKEKFDISAISKVTGRPEEEIHKLKNGKAE